MKSRKVIIIDLDMILHFKVVDPEIITSIFGNNSLVKKIDNVLQKMNNLDYITNNKYLFKVRMLTYSILARKPFKDICNIYCKKYILFGRENLQLNLFLLKKLRKKGYRVAILTHNLYADKLSDIYPIRFVLNKRKFIRKAIKKNNIVYMIGDNYSDDIKTAKKFGIISVYVGDSKFISKKSEYSFFTFKEAIDFIIARD